MVKTGIDCLFIFIETGSLLEAADAMFLHGNISEEEEEDESDFLCIEPTKKKTKSKTLSPKKKTKAVAAKQIKFCHSTSPGKETSTDETRQADDLQPLPATIDSNEDTENQSMIVDNGTLSK